MFVRLLRFEGTSPDKAFRSSRLLWIGHIAVGVKKGKLIEPSSAAKERKSSLGVIFYSQNFKSLNMS